MSIQIAVFGCGYWGKNHVRTLSELDALACVVDSDLDAAQNLAEKHNTVVKSAEEVFADPDIDAIVMALPPHMHAQIASSAFAAGKHVFAEKPIALLPEDAQSMVDAAGSAGKVLMAGHILRYHNAFRAIMEIVEGGTLGAIKYVQSHRLGFGKFHRKFDAIWDLAPHDLSLLLSVAGREPINVTASPVALANEQTDFAHIELDFGDGLKGHINVSRFSPYVERRVIVVGEKAMVVWDDTQSDWDKKVSIHSYHQTASGEAYTKDEPVFVPCEQGMALTDELAHFIDCVSSGKNPLTDGRQGLDVVRILNAATSPS